MESVEKTVNLYSSFKACPVLDEKATTTFVDVPLEYDNNCPATFALTPGKVTLAVESITTFCCCTVAKSLTSDQVNLS